MTLSKLHYVNVGGHGTFAGSSTPQADLGALLEYLETNEKRKMLIHFHGGLVREETHRYPKRLTPLSHGKHY